MHLSPALRALTLLSTLALVPSTAVLAEEAGWYLEGRGAWSDLDDAEGEAQAPAAGAPGCDLAIPGLGCVAPGPGAGPGAMQDSTLRFDDGDAYGLSFGRQFRNGLRPEISLEFLENDLDSVRLSDGTTQPADGKLRAYGAMANLWYDIATPWPVRPYIGGGLGGREIEISNDSDADDQVFGWQVGAGLGYQVIDRLTLSLDYRYLDGDDPRFEDANGNRFESEFSGQTVGLGLRYMLFPVAPPDRDSDGVIDERDDCPDTAAGVTVDASGCPLDSDNDGVSDPTDDCPATPANTPVDDNGCALDGDGDGVSDAQDRCPDTPIGTPVDSSGCARDGDSDGVIDPQDECPGTARGTAVMSNGCAAGQSVELEGVEFEFNSARLRPAAERVLMDAVETLRASPGFDVEIQGHTDTQGAADYNRDLSQQRAESVREFLIAKGVSATRLTARGYGETRPKTPDNTLEDHARNRRVELKVLETNDR